MRRAEGADERGEVHARRRHVGAIEVIVDAEALHAGLRPGGDIGPVLRDEFIGAVADAVHADPREDLRAQLDRRSPQSLHVRERADRMPLAVVVAAGRPDGIRDVVQEAEDVVRAHRPVAEPALRRGAVVELEGVVDAEGDGERTGVLAEVFPGVTRADLGGARVIEVRIRIGGDAFGFGRLAADHREEQGLLPPDLAIEDAVKGVGELRGAPVTDGERPIGRKLVQAAELAPAEVRLELVRQREADLITGRPFRALLAREGEKDAEVLLAEATDRDAGGGGIVADEVDGPADDGTAGGVALGVGGGDAGELSADGLADIDREIRSALALGLMTDGGPYAGHALAPVGERAGSMPFVDLGFGGKDDRRPGAGVEQTARPRQGGKEHQAGQCEKAGHGVRRVSGEPRVSSMEY